MRKIKIQYIRWFVIIIVSFLFTLSYKLDMQLLEGSLIGSRFVGIHLIDPFATLEVIATHGNLPVNLAIGACLVIAFYLITGGRIFCSWVCPFGLLSELGEKAHLFLVQRGVTKGGRKLPVGRYWFWSLWLVFAAVTGYLVFEICNIMAITSRSLIYGISFATFLIIPVLLGEIFIVRRFWCRSVCPVGSTYGLLNKVSAGRIAWQGNCTKCGKCIDVCYDHETLAFIETETPNGEKPHYVNNTGCTFCAMCIDVCPTKCLTYRNRLKNLV